MILWLARISRGEITVLSDGSPWRPLIDVADMARAIDWAIDRPAQNGGRYLAVNAGSNEPQLSSPRPRKCCCRCNSWHQGLNQHLGAR